MTRLTAKDILAMYPPNSAHARFWQEEEERAEASDFGGEFWADRVARLKREKRYEEALETMRNLPPYPAVPPERMICLRHLVRGRMKFGQECNELLQLLYECGVENSALCGEPAITTTRPIGASKEPSTYPGFNAMTIFHALAKRHGLPLDYQTVGYEKVGALNKTDRKWIAAAWGEPKQHLDPFELYRPLWEVARELFTRELEAQQQEFYESMRSILNAPPTPKPSVPYSADRTFPRPKKRTPWWWPFG